MKAESDFNSKIKNGPVQSLSRARPLMHDPSRSRHLFASLIEPIRRLVNVKMQDEETLISHNKKVKQAKNTFKSHTGTKNLNKFVAHAEEHKKAAANSDTASQQELKDKEFKQWMVLLVTDDADHKKFGSLQSGLSSQCWLN